MSFGFLVSIFLMTNGVNAILGGIEYSYHVTEMRSIIRQYFISMIMSIMLSLILVVTVAITLYFDQFRKQVN